MHRPHLLVIDDDQTVQALIRHTLKDDFTVASAADGKAAYSQALVARPDLIVLDLNMPVWDGIQTLVAFRGNPDLSLIPIVVISCDFITEIMQGAIEAAPDDYVQKSGNWPVVLKDRLLLRFAALTSHST